QQPAREQREPESPDRPEVQRRPGGENGCAADREQGRGQRIAARRRLGLAGELGGEWLWGRDAQPREPHPEQRTSPLREQRLRGDAAAVLEHLGDLRGRVPRAGECRGKLGVGDLGAGRRPQAKRELAGRVQCVLQRGEPFEHAVLVDQLARIACDRFELGQYPGQTFPQSREGCCVALALPSRNTRSHIAILQPRSLLIRITSEASGPKRSPASQSRWDLQGAVAIVAVATWGESDTPCSSSTTTTACECCAV